MTTVLTITLVPDDEAETGGDVGSDDEVSVDEPEVDHPGRGIFAIASFGIGLADVVG